jgi:hypothetical protein
VDLRVDEVDADKVIFDQDLAFFGLGDGEVGLVLQHFGAAVFFHDHALHRLGDGGNSHCAGMCESACP